MHIPTKLSAGRHAIVDADEYDFLYKAAFDRFISELDAAREEAEKHGWLSLQQVRARLGLDASA